MHILVMIAGIVAAGCFWWYRVQYMSKAAGEVADAVGRVRGNMRRSALRKKSAISPIAAIDDPVTAASTVVLAIASEDMAVSDEMEKRLRDKIAVIAASENQIDEAVIYAKWAADQVADVSIVIDKIAFLLKDRLHREEKEELVAMAQSVALPDERHAMFGRRIETLRRKLGLVIRD
jgi:hypothetical protein